MLFRSASTADFDKAAAAATRRRIFGELEGKPVLVIGTHFAGPTAGRVVRDRQAWKMLVQGRVPDAPASLAE